MINAKTISAFLLLLILLTGHFLMPIGIAQRAPDGWTLHKPRESYALADATTIVPWLWRLDWGEALSKDRVASESLELSWRGADGALLQLNSGKLKIEATDRLLLEGCEVSELPVAHELVLIPQDDSTLLKAGEAQTSCLQLDTYIRLEAHGGRIHLTKLTYDGALKPRLNQEHLLWSLSLAFWAALLCLPMIEAAVCSSLLGGVALLWEPNIWAAWLRLPLLQSPYYALYLSSILLLLLGTPIVLFRARSAWYWQATGALYGLILGGVIIDQLEGGMGYWLVVLLLYQLLWLLQLSARALSYYSFWAILLPLGLVVSLDVALNHSETAKSWRQGLRWEEWNDALRVRNPTQNKLAQAFHSFESLKEAEPTTYPLSGYPVLITPRQAPTRIVALGGSSTGGAGEHTSLAYFFPAKLSEEAGGEVEVLNQGVGGWTTWHIERYFQQRWEELDADVVILYVGHNDSWEVNPATLPQLYTAWQAKKRGGWRSWMRRSALLQWGLVLQGSGLLVGKKAPAQSLAEFRSTMLSILDITNQIPVLLVGEVVFGAPSSVAPYHRQLQQLGVGEGRAYLDATAILNKSTYFLDNIHLSQKGHQILAEAIHQRLQEEGWLTEEEHE